MTKPKIDDASINERHLTGFRRFQNAALRALSVLSTSLRPAPKGTDKKKAEASLKVSDMKSLVSTYKEAVSGERSVLGLSGHQQEQWPEEMVVRWEDPDGDAQT
ncbi:MAG: hypothetical protein WA666_07340 [Nitrospirota bacterium]